MKKNLRKFLRELGNTIKRHPLEIALLGTAFVPPAIYATDMKNGNSSQEQESCNPFSRPPFKFLDEFEDYSNKGIKIIDRYRLLDNETTDVIYIWKDKSDTYRVIEREQEGRMKRFIFTTFDSKGNFTSEVTIPDSNENGEFDCGDLLY